MTILVRLTPGEAAYADYIGRARRNYAIEVGLKGAHGLADDGDDFVQQDILSAMTELAVAKHLGLYWHATVGRVDEPDVGGFVEVRRSKRKDGYLLLHPSCHADRPYVLTFCEPPAVHIMGWMMGSEGQALWYWKKQWERPCFAVPQSDLRKSDTLWRVGVQAIKRRTLE